jgi:TolB-like protein
MTYMTNNPPLDLHAALKGARAKGRKTDIDLYERFGQIKGAARDWLKDLGKNGYEHSERLEQYLAELTKKLIERDLLTQAEIFVLLCAAYMHDIGYWQNGQLQVKGHPERSRKLIEDWPDTYLLGDFPSLGGAIPGVAQAVGWVCYGHTEEAYLPLLQVPNSFADQSLSSEILNLRKLSALLRLADEADDPYIRLSEHGTPSIRAMTPLVKIGEETIRWYWRQAGAYDPGPWVRHLKQKQSILATSIDYLRDLTNLGWYLVLEPQVPETTLPLPDKPSIAVLPFLNMSDDPKQEFFSDGMTEEIITALSRSPELFVIARTSTFVYKGKSVDVKRVSEELGVHYVLEGSVRRSGEMIRITAQLVDAMTGYHLWVDRYDRSLREIFVIQDEITLKIMEAVHVKLEPGENILETGKGAGNLEAFLKFLEAREHFHHWNKEEIAISRKLFEEVIALDQDYAAAYLFLAGTHMVDVWLGTSKSPKESVELAIELGEKAIALDASVAAFQAYLGNSYIMARQFEKAVTLAKNALALRQDSSEVLFWAANVISWSGKPEEAIPLFQKSIRLNPFAPGYYFHAFSLTYRLAGRYSEALEQAKKAVEQDPKNPIAHIALAASYILVGREEEARVAAADVLRINPNFSAEQYVRGLPLKDQLQAERYIEALRKAGLR